MLICILTANHRLEIDPATIGCGISQLSCVMTGMHMCGNISSAPLTERTEYLLAWASHCAPEAGLPSPFHIRMQLQKGPKRVCKLTPIDISDHRMCCSVRGHLHDSFLKRVFWPFIVQARRLCWSKTRQSWTKNKLHKRAHVRAFFCTRASPSLVCFPFLGFFHSGCARTSRRSQRRLRCCSCKQMVAS